MSWKGDRGSWNTSLAQGNVEMGALAGHQGLMASQPFCGKAEIKG